MTEDAEQLWTIGAIIEATDELAERAREDVHAAVASLPGLSRPPQLRPVKEDRESWQQDLSEGRRLTEGPDAEMRPVWQLEFVLTGSETQRERASEAMRRALCPDEFHPGLCEIPWSAMWYPGLPEDAG